MSGESVDGAAVSGSGRVRELVRFGWLVAEIRGRVRLGATDPAESGGLSPGSRKDHALPLSSERSWHEQFFELLGVVVSVADAVGVGSITAQRVAVGARRDDDSADSAATYVTELARRTIDNPDLWPQFAETVYLWDAAIQDRLAPGPFGEASAYQLGRGIGETTWALDANADASDLASWEFLFGPQRFAALRDLLLRHSANFTAMTASAVGESLARWCRVARNEKLRSQSDALGYLRRQARVWRDLLVTNRDPTDLARPMTPKTRVLVVLGLFGTLWQQTLTFVVGAVALGFGAYSVKSSGSTANNVVPTVLGLVGVSGAALSAKIQSSAQSLLDTIKSEYRFGMVIDGVTMTPDPPKRGEPRSRLLEWWGRRRLRQALHLRVVSAEEELIDARAVPNDVFGFEEIFATVGLQNGRARLRTSVKAPDGHRRPLEVHKHGDRLWLTGYVSADDKEKLDAGGSAERWVMLWMRRSRDAEILVELPVPGIEEQSLGDGSVDNGFRLFVHFTP